MTRYHKVLMNVLIIAVVVSMGYFMPTSVLANTSVTDEASLISAIEANDTDIYLKNTINLTKSIELSKGKNLTIHGQGHSLVAKNLLVKGIFTLEDSANLFLNDLTLDGQAHSKIITAKNHSTVSITGGAICHGTSKNDERAACGGAIYLLDSKLSLENVALKGNKAQYNSTLHGPNKVVYGGAICASGQSQLECLNCDFLDNEAGNNDEASDISSCGGALFIAKDSAVKLRGGSIQKSLSSQLGGAIYNEGALDLGENLKLSNNKATFAGGGIYNEGELFVDQVTFLDNHVGENANLDSHSLALGELAGANIYAKKALTITPKASFDEGDVRILDKRSAIILTGELKNKINVSISEKPKHDEQATHSKGLLEEAERYVGYTVAKGDEGYSVSKEDAIKLHYFSKDKTPHEKKVGRTIVADYDDQVSLGTWDFVYNPEEKTVVLGQRALLIYNANRDRFKGAGFSDGTIKKRTVLRYLHLKTPMDKSCAVDKNQ